MISIDLHCLSFHLHFWTHYLMVKLHYSNFRIITGLSWLSEFVGFFIVVFFCLFVFCFQIRHTRWESERGPDIFSPPVSSDRGTVDHRPGSITREDWTQSITSPRYSYEYCWNSFPYEKQTNQQALCKWKPCHQALVHRSI